MSRSTGLHRFAVFTSFATFVLIFAGGLVTSTGSGLAVPDWPLSFGQVFPRMEGGVLFEHGHRMIAATVGFLTVILCIWLLKAEPRQWVKRLGIAALILVILQGVLGGVTVLLRLPNATSIGHAALAQLFLCVTVAIAVVTGPRWLEESSPHEGAGAAATRKLTLGALVAVYAQILLGALVRHTGSGLIIPTFPLANGRLWPVIDNPYVAYQMAHRVGALIVTILVLWEAVRLMARHGGEPRLRRPAVALLAVLVWQVFLGALTIWTAKSVIPTTLHVVSGAILLAVALVTTMRTHRVLRGPHAPRELSVPLSNRTPPL